MSRALLLIWNEKDRERALHWVKVAPIGSRIEMRGPKRTLPQNARMWAMLTDVATQKEHNGRRYKPDVWKALFMDQVGREVELVPSLDNSSMVSMGHSSSEMTTQQMSDLIELMFAWGAENGIQWSDPTIQSYEDMRR